MVCVSDRKCMELCSDSFFPCYDFQYENKEAHTFEQVAAVKIRHVGFALKKGVNVMLLDLDVGFLRNPMILYEGFLENPNIQVNRKFDFELLPFLYCISMCLSIVRWSVRWTLGGQWTGSRV